jgi:hypothetical protein
MRSSNIRYCYLLAVGRLIYSLSCLLESCQYGFQLLKNHQRRVGEALCTQYGDSCTALRRKYRREWSEVSEARGDTGVPTYTAEVKALLGK